MRRPWRHRDSRKTSFTGDASFSIKTTKSPQRLLRGERLAPPDHGEVSVEVVVKLCGAHLEHAYRALRVRAPGVQAPRRCAFGAAGAVLVVSTAANVVHVYDLGSGKRVASERRGPANLRHACTSGLETAVVFGDALSPTMDLQLGHPARQTVRLEGHAAQVKCVALSEDGAVAVSGGRGGEAFAWQLPPLGATAAAAAAPPLRTPLLGHGEASVKCCCIAPGGAMGATGDSQGRLLVWDLPSGRPLAGLAPSTAEPLTCCAASTGGGALAAGTRSGKLAVWRRQGSDGITAGGAGGSGTAAEAVEGLGSRGWRALELHGGWRHAEGSKVRGVALSADARLLASVGDDCKVMLWDLDTRQLLMSVTEHTRPVRCCAFSPDGRRLAACADDGLLCVLDVALLQRPPPVQEGHSAAGRLRVACMLGAVLQPPPPPVPAAAMPAASREPMQRAPGSGAGQAAASAGLIAAHAGGGGGSAAASPAAEHDVSTACSAAGTSQTAWALGLRAQRAAAADGRGQPLLDCALIAPELSDLDLDAAHDAPACLVAVAAAPSGALMTWHVAGEAAPPTAAWRVASAAAGDPVAYASFDGGLLATASARGALAVEPIAAGGAAPRSAHLQQHTSVAGVALCAALGCLAVVGSDRKEGSAGGVWVWEFGALHELEAAASAAPSGDGAADAGALAGGGEADVAPPDPLSAPAGFGTTEGAGRARGKGLLQGWAHAFAAALSPARRGGGGGLLGAPEAACAGVGDEARWGEHVLRSPAPVRVYTSHKASLRCCAWAAAGEYHGGGGAGDGSRGDRGRAAQPPSRLLVAGSSAGWLVVVDVGQEGGDEELVRYPVHSAEVGACAFASDGMTVASADVRGRVVLWSAVTGCQLQVLTLHTARVCSLVLSDGAEWASQPRRARLAVGDVSGLVSVWDACEGALLGAGAVHDGAVGTCRFCPGEEAALVTCGTDGRIVLLEVDDAVQRLYAEGFRSLYKRCAKHKNFVHLEATLTWHLQHGMAQDPATVQRLVAEAARDGDAAALAALLPLAGRAGWLLHLGPITMGGSGGAAASSQPALGGARSMHERCASGLRRSTTVAVQPGPWRPTGLDVLGASSGGLGSFHAILSRPTGMDVLGASFGGLDSSFHANPSRLADAVDGSDSFARRASPQGAASPSDTPTGGATPTRAMSPSPSGRDRGPRATAALETLHELAMTAAGKGEAQAPALAVAARALLPLPSRAHQRRATAPCVLLSAEEPCAAQQLPPLPPPPPPPPPLRSYGTFGSNDSAVAAAAAAACAAHADTTTNTSNNNNDNSSSINSNNDSSGKSCEPTSRARPGAAAGNDAGQPPLGRPRWLQRLWGGGPSTACAVGGEAAGPLGRRSSVGPIDSSLGQLGLAWEGGRSEDAAATGGWRATLQRGLNNVPWVPGWRASVGPVLPRDGATVGASPQQGGDGRKSKGGEDLLQVAVRSRQAQCSRVVVDALLAGRFSRASVLVHLHAGLLALIRDPQHRRLTRRLLKHLPLMTNGEVEVDSRLIAHGSHVYRCAAHASSQRLWGACSATDAAAASAAPLLAALDVLIARASWADSIMGLAIMPLMAGARRAAGWALNARAWMTRRATAREVVRVTAAAQLLPLSGVAQIQMGSHALLRELSRADAAADLYGRELLRCVIRVKWDSFGRAFLLMQFLQFVVFAVLYLTYLAVAVYHNDPEWSAAQLVSEPAGVAAVVLEVLLCVMMAGQAADEFKQMLTYKREYWNSLWNWMDVGSCVLITVISLLHITRLNHEAFIVLVALEVLLLCFRALYFALAVEHFGALLRMLLMVAKDMRWFFVLLLFLLCSFGLTFSVLLYTPGEPGSAAWGGPTNPYATFGNALLQLFATMLGDVQFTTFDQVLALNTAPAVLAVILAAVYSVLVLIVLVNLLIAIVDETYGAVKEVEADTMLRNRALIIDEIESTLTAGTVADLNTRVLLPFVHVLVPQQALQARVRKDTRYKISRLKQLVKAGAGATVAAAHAAKGAPQVVVQGADGSLWGGHKDHEGEGGGASASGAWTEPPGLRSWPQPNPHQQEQQQQQQQQSVLAAVSHLGSAVQALSSERAVDSAALAQLSRQVQALGEQVGAVGELLEAVLLQTKERGAHQQQQQQQQQPQP